jgi:putative phosphoesterase
MKVALVSDIHGNRWALDAVLEHIERQRVDAVWNLGDILSGPLLPEETADRLMPLGLLTIAGNHERQLLAVAEGPGKASDEYAFAHTRPEQREWVLSLPAEAWPREDVWLFHGTPASDDEPFLETHVDGVGVRLATTNEIAGRLPMRARLMACGHTHLPRVVQVAEDCLVVNPGSVGLQAFEYHVRGEAFRVDNGTPHASYAVVAETSGGWDVDLFRVRYDWETTARLAEKNGRPEWAVALRTGYAR